MDPDDRLNRRGASVSSVWRGTNSIAVEFKGRLLLSKLKKPIAVYCMLRRAERNGNGGRRSKTVRIKYNKSRRS